MPKYRDRLYLRFRDQNGKQQFYRASYDSKSRLRPGWCIINGAPEHHPEAIYYERVKRDGRWTWQSLADDAVIARKSAPAERPQPASEKPKTVDGFRLDDEIAVYLSNIAKLAPKTYKAYKLSLELFQECCKRTYVHQITKQDLQAFDTFLLEQDNDDRTRHNRVGHIVTFLRNREGRRLGPEIKDVSIKVKYVESPPEAYTGQELEDLFRVSSDDEKFLWRFFLGTGFRESEASVAESMDINHDTKSIRVDEKPWFSFKPKDCEKRTVPISDDLIAAIDARAKLGSCSLLFGVNGKPDGHLLRRLKTVAWKGGLKCGKCVGSVDGKQVSCADAPVCKHWILHRFRKNFATDRHNAGAAARKIQKWLGHSDLETTLRYLAIGDGTTEEVRNIVNGVHRGL
jgi:integrase